MDLFDVAKSCVRRWYVFLPLILIAVLFSYRTYTGVQPVYYGTATVGLAPPSVSAPVPTNEVRTNALLNNGGVILVSNLLALGMSDASVRTQVSAQGGLPDYTATVFSVPGGQLPLIVIEASSPDPALVAQTIELVSAQGEGTLIGLQERAGVPPEVMLHTYPLGSVGEPVPAMPSRTRSTVAVFVAGVGLAVLLTVLVDIYMVRRKDRRSEARQNPETAPAAATTRDGEPVDSLVTVPDRSVTGDQ